MPKIPKRPCGYPNCPRLTDSAYCEEHSKLVMQNYERYSRDRRHGQRYATAWPAIRKAYIAKHPLCERCAAKGIYTKVAEVHHIRPLSDGGTNAESNLVSLCRKCHAEVHGEMGTRTHNGVVYSYDGNRHA